MQKPFTFVSILIVSFVALGAGAYFLLNFQKDRTTSLSKLPVDVTLGTTKPATENTPATGNLKVQGANIVPPKQQQQLSTPNKFTDYEQFAASTSTQYQDEVIGTGSEASTGDTVAMVYKGWLTDGTLFDQSKTNELNQIETFNFKLGAGQVIAGWEQGISGMKEGGKRRLVIPATFGYGETEQGPIPPNSMLIFDVELIQVQKP